MLMQLNKIINESLIDFPGKIAVVAFVRGCNWRCPACYAKQVIEGKGNYDLFNYIDDWTDGVVLCGGEPTLQPDLILFLRKIRESGMAIKVDTNGSNPHILSCILKEKLADYVAMDVKGPLYLYEQLTGCCNSFGVEESMNILSNSNVDYEFRTTIVPVFRDNRKNKISFLTVEEAEDMARWIAEVTENSQHKYYLQKFVPIKNELLDSRLESFPETPDSLMEKIHEAVIKYFPNCKIR